MKEPLRIYSTRSMGGYAREVIRELAAFSSREELVAGEADDRGLAVTKFADGEMEVEVCGSVRGQDVYLFASSARNSLGIGLEECKIEMYNAVDALRRAGPRRITLIEPYVTAGRSDRTTRRNSVGLWVHYKTLIGLGVDQLITFNLHSDMSMAMVDPTACAMGNIPALKLLKAYMTRTCIGDRATLEGVVKREWVFCSVDAGGEVLAKKFASSFGTNLVVAHKQRDYGSPNTVLSTRILSETPLKGKTVWIVDDILDTGRSVYRLIQELRSRGVRRVNIAVVHPVFSPPALSALAELHREGLLDSVLTTDTIPLAARDLAACPFVHVVPSARLAAEVVHRLHCDASLSELYDPFQPGLYFKAQGESLGVG